MPHDYATAVDTLIRNQLQTRARQFVAHKDFKPDWPTVVVLPGGMGSELSITDESFTSMSNPWQAVPSVHPLWIRIKKLKRILRGDPLRIKLDLSGQDLQGYLCISTGALKVVGSPYNGVSAGLQARHINYVDFGFDWRKPAGLAADYLLLFLDMLEREARAKHDQSLLPVGILAHSQGGLVAKQFAEACTARDATEPGFSKSRYRFIVTAGTPFFGTLDHLNRYYNGLSNQDKLVSPEFVLMHTFENLAEDPDFADRWMSAINNWRGLVASLPGLYQLLPSPALTDASARERVGLSRYPVRDKNGIGPVDFLADPDRLPPWLVNYYRQHKATHERESEQIAKPLTGYARERFFCVRGLLEKKKNVAYKLLELHLNPDVRTTYDLKLGQVWKELARHPAMRILQGNMHDGVVPAWSAVLDESHQVMTIAGAEHRDIVKHQKVLELVEALALDRNWGAVMRTPGNEEGPIEEGPIDDAARVGEEDVPEPEGLAEEADDETILQLSAAAFEEYEEEEWTQAPAGGS